MLLFVDDLKAYCERDFGVAYLLWESPIQGRYPARGCLKEIKQWVAILYDSEINADFPSLKKPDRSAYIHNYIRREIALDLKVSESQLRFCYECIDWLQSSQ